MKSLHIRNVDPLVLHKLERLARLHHRSVQGELRHILEQAVRYLPRQEEFDISELHLVAAEESPRYGEDERYET